MIASALAAVAHLVSGVSVEWRCDPHADVPRIYFGNHSSHLDFIVIWAALPPPLRKLARPVAGSDYWARGAIRRYLAAQVFNAVLIDRSAASASGDTATARHAVYRMAEEMTGRTSLIVFPEGTRSADGEVGEFKSGLFHLSRLRPHAELIPVHLENLNRILPKGEILPVPMLSRIIFGTRVFASPTEEKDAFLQRARAALIQLGRVS
jgi:1-acyl-sn-glycerol-3-phosphate acyltransferase